MKDLLISVITTIILITVVIVFLRWYQRSRKQAQERRKRNTQKFQVVRASLVKGGVAQELVCTVIGERNAIEVVKRCSEEDKEKDYSFYYTSANEWLRKLV